MSINAEVYVDGRGTDRFHEFDLVIAMAELSFRFDTPDLIKDAYAWADRVTTIYLSSIRGLRRAYGVLAEQKIREFHKNLYEAMALKDKKAIERLKEVKGELEVLAAQPIQNGRRSQMLQR